MRGIASWLYRGFVPVTEWIDPSWLVKDFSLGLLAFERTIWIGIMSMCRKMGINK